jgi:hypothetical protein
MSDFPAGAAPEGAVYAPLTVLELAALVAEAGHQAAVSRTEDGTAYVDATVDDARYLAYVAAVDGAAQGLCFSATFRRDDGLGDDALNAWNGARRFARLHATDEGDVRVEWAVPIGGGISRALVLACLDVWRHRLGEL